MEQQSRPFRISDALVAVAALAVALAVIRPAFELSTYLGGSRQGLDRVAFLARVFACPALVVSSAAVLALGLRPPRRRIADDAGAILCASGLLYVALMAANVYARTFGKGGDGLRGVPFSHLATLYMVDVMPWSGHGVACAVLALGLAGRLRRGPGWLGRVGWWVGWSWVALYLSSALVAVFA